MARLLAAVVCATALLKSTPRRYMAPKSRVTCVISRLRINLNPKTRMPVSSGIRNSSEKVNSITATPRRALVDLVWIFIVSFPYSAVQMLGREGRPPITSSACAQIPIFELKNRYGASGPY